APLQDFVYLAWGVPTIANTIKEGHYKSGDPAILGYYSKLQDKQALNSMTLAEMAALAHAILRETRKSTYYVGGPDEIGIFPAKGPGHVTLPPLPDNKASATRFFPKEGFLFTREHPEGQAAGAGGMAIFFEDFQRPLNEVVTQFFLASEFKD